MKKLFLSILIMLLFPALYLNAIIIDSSLLQDKYNYRDQQDAVATAVCKTATRLFKDKNDLTSVILIIPANSTVEVIAADSAFLIVTFEGNRGYINSEHAEIRKEAKTVQPVQSGTGDYLSTGRPVQVTKVSRKDYLENKYGASLARRISEGKIWKGMRNEMVRDSWGSPMKITSMISGNSINEEWFYKSTTLFFEDNKLVGWKQSKD